MPDNMITQDAAPELNLIETEIRKLFQPFDIIRSPRFIGPICIGQLNRSPSNEIIVRAELKAGLTIHMYNILQIKLIHKTRGPVDTLELNIRELTKNNDIYYVDNDKTAWGRTKSEPSDKMRFQIRNAVETYLDAFRKSK